MKLLTLSDFSILTDDSINIQVTIEKRDGLYTSKYNQNVGRFKRVKISNGFKNRIATGVVKCCKFNFQSRMFPPSPDWPKDGLN